ncbi:DUF4340 domain-containing protein [Christensenella timonensis]|uniref:DUF4340 domain-containing protein n=1 Tax=Christensenella timonensis TaxID=1816678 RepID=UPI00082E0839|nr:DUF4340 domain-containing protein [Christensenella timonensis]
MKKSRGAITGIVCAAAAIAVCCALLLVPGDNQTAGAAVSLLEQDDGALFDAVTVKNEEGEYTIRWDGKAYHMDTLAGAKLNEGLADNLYYGLFLMEGTPLNTTEGEDAYGLTKPRATVTLTGTDITKRFLLGNRAPAGDGYYMKAEGDDTVYLIDERYAGLLERTAQDYRSMQLVDFVYESDYNDLQSIGISGKDMLGMAFVQSEDGYRMEEPVQYMCVQDDLKVLLLEPILHLQADEYAGKESPAEMGFDDPAYTIALSYRGEDIRLLIGNDVGGKRYITVAGSGEAYLVGTDKLAFLKTDYREAIGESLYYRSIADIANITLEGDGRNDTFAITERQGTYAALHEGTEVAGETLVPLVNALMGMSLSGTAGQAEQAQAELRAVVTLEDGRQDTVSLFRLDDGKYAVEVNGQRLFTTAAENVERIFEKWREAAA